VWFEVGSYGEDDRSLLLVGDFSDRDATLVDAFATVHVSWETLANSAFIIVLTDLRAGSDIQKASTCLFGTAALISPSLRAPATALGLAPLPTAPARRSIAPSRRAMGPFRVERLLGLATVLSPDTGRETRCSRIPREHWRRRRLVSSARCNPQLARAAARPAGGAPRGGKRTGVASQLARAFVCASERSPERAHAPASRQRRRRGAAGGVARSKRRVVWKFRMLTRRSWVAKETGRHRGVVTQTVAAAGASIGMLARSRRNGSRMSVVEAIAVSYQTPSW
jgi:hypothetical protein